MPSELKDKLVPIILDFVQKVDNLGLYTSAFVFSLNGDFMTRFGNAPQEGVELVKLHYILSLLCAKLEQDGNYSHYESINLKDRVSGPSSEEIADKLALTLLTTPSDMIPQPVLDTLMEYVNSRRP